MADNNNVPPPPNTSEEKAKGVVVSTTKYVYVCSKLACDNAYTTWFPGAKAANDMPRKDRQVLIKGGTGVANNHLVTPHGVVTRITAEELALIRKSCPGFVRHEKGGFLKVLDKDPSAKDVSSMADDMADDKSEQATRQTVYPNKGMEQQ